VLQLGFFDERNLFELSHTAFPGERLVACRNTELGKLRAHKRMSLLEARTQALEKVRGMVARGRLRGRADIAVRVGKVVTPDWDLIPGTPLRQGEPMPSGEATRHGGPSPRAV